MKRSTIFYSWQSDDQETNKYIKNSLERAVEAIAEDPTIENSPRLDHDTKYTLGSPDIPTTILTKIDNCKLFVADVSIVGKYKQRKLVNQNVLFELGYSIGKHSTTNVLLLFNKDNGHITDLPFDLRSKRAITFSIKNDPNGDKLVDELKQAIHLQLTASDINTATSTTPFLDENEKLIMRCFAGISKNKVIIIQRTVNGNQHIIPLGVVDAKLLNNLSFQMDEAEVIANFDSLVEKKLLNKTMSPDGRTPQYSLTKEGLQYAKRLPEYVKDSSSIQIL